MNDLKPRKICHYAVATELGGAERSLLELVSHLDESSNHRYYAEVLLPKNSGALIPELEKKKISYSVLALPGQILAMTRETPFKTLAKIIFSLPLLCGYLIQAAKSISTMKPEIVHTNGLKCHVFGAFIGMATGKPILWHFRDILGSKSLRFLFGLLSFFPRIHIVANSEATARSLGAVRRKAKVIYNGLDPQAFNKHPNSIFNEKYNWGHDIPIVGIVGVLARWKGQEEFIHMARLALERGVKARFVVVGDEIYDTDGDAGYKQTLMGLVEKHGLSEYVKFWGFEKDSAKAINGLDVLVHASIKAEPFGRVVLEAFACGVPVIASAGGGILELVEDGRRGLLAKPGDVEGMTSALKKILDDPDSTSKRTESAERFFKEKFTVQTHVQQIAGLYDEILT